MKHIFLALITLIVLAPQARAENDVVRFGSLRIPTAVMIGIEKGYFAEKKINVDYKFFKSGAEIGPAMATGQIDGATTTAGAPLFNALLRGIKLKIVADMATLDPTSPGGDPTAIIVRSKLAKDGQVKGAKDLVGRKIGIAAPGQILDTIVRQYMEDAGVAADKYTLISMPMPDMILALESGAIDAAVMVDPFPTIAKQRGVGEVLAKGTDVLPGLQQAFIAFGPLLTEQNRDLGQRFIDAYEKANTWLRKAVSDPEGRKEVAAIYQKYVPAKSAELYEKIALNTAAANLDINVAGKNGLIWTIGELNKRGLLKGNPKIADFVDTGFIKKFEGNK